MDMEIAGKGAAGLPSSLPLLKRLAIPLFTAGQHGGGGGSKIGVMKFMDLPLCEISAVVFNVATVATKGGIIMAAIAAVLRRMRRLAGRAERC